MSVADDMRLRLSAQRGLLRHITRSMRAVSVDVVPGEKRAWIRFVFDGVPPPEEEETASCACTEILTDFIDDWVFETEMVETPYPEKIAHRRIVVFARCEDDWVLNPPSK